MKQIKILWIHFEFVAVNFHGLSVFSSSLGCNFVDAMIFSFSKKKINSFKDVFVEDVNSAGGRLPTNAKIILKIPQYFFKVDFSLLLKNILKSKETQNQLFNDIFNFCYVYDNIFTIGLLQPHDLSE